MDDLFSGDERDRIATAIEEAETASGAEIVPYVALRSDEYPAVRWRGGVLAALCAAGLLGLLQAIPLPELPFFLTGTLLLATIPLVGLLGAFAAGSLPALVRLLTSTREVDRAVERRALQAFVEEEVFATRNRTGILLFVSLLEHRIEVRADVGIDRQVDETAWTDVTAHIRRGIEDDRLTRGLLDGIGCCGRLLDEHGVEARPDGVDELDDRVRTNTNDG
jgi:putative membrane protein